MSEHPTRRRFLKSAAAVTAGGVVGRLAAPASAQAQPPSRQDSQLAGGGSSDGGPVVIASANGIPAVAKAMAMIREGQDPLDAVVAGVNIVESDPDDHSVGYGGLPNEDGVVELDSCVMHGPTHNAGAVAALRNIKTPSQVARLVMERTDHVLLVGEGALRFARAHGFEEVDLLTDAARREWLKWKESRPDDDWLPPLVPQAMPGQRSSSAADVLRSPAGYEFTYGTINCCALDQRKDLAGVTTTSGLSYKIPGRVGDSPLIGAGLYVDNRVGAAGATGRGEAVILNCGSFAIVEQMRQGKTPVEACITVLKRIADNNLDPRLRDKQGHPNFDVKLYAIRNDGQYGSASLWSGAEFAVSTVQGSRLEKCAYLYKRPA